VKGGGVKSMLGQPGKGGGKMGCAFYRGKTGTGFSG